MTPAEPNRSGGEDGQGEEDWPEASRWNDQKDSMKPLYRPRSTGARRCAGAGRRRD